jgi:hypothetical protein
MKVIHALVTEGCHRNCSHRLPDVNTICGTYSKERTSAKGIWEEGPGGMGYLGPRGRN